MRQNVFKGIKDANHAMLERQLISYDQANYDVGIFNRKSGRQSIQLNKVSVYYYLCGCKTGPPIFFHEID